MIRRAFAAWSWFWFTSGSPEVLRVLRSAIALWLLAFYLIRSIDLPFFYSEHGLLPLAALREAMPTDWRFSVFEVFSSDGALWIGNGIFLASLLMLGLNRFPRIAAVVALVLHVSFLHRNLAVVYGIDLIAGYFLFYFAIAWTRDLASVALRLCQIQVCVIYAYSGLEKLKGASWWSGEALWSVLANVDYARFDFSWVSHVPLLVVVASYLTLAWEIYFCALVWLSGWRKAILGVGILVHAGIALTIHITFFAGLMILSYIAFLKEDEIRNILRKFRTLVFR